MGEYLQMTFFQGNHAVFEFLIAGYANQVTGKGKTDHLPFTVSRASFQHEGATDDGVNLAGWAVLTNQTCAGGNLFSLADICQGLKLVCTDAPKKA
ncbi:hypothetical protein GCM10027217_11550 [Pseudomaricurvus hydrocarbonicus]